MKILIIGLVLLLLLSSFTVSAEISKADHKKIIHQLIALKNAINSGDVVLILDMLSPNAKPGLSDEIDTALRRANISCWIEEIEIISLEELEDNKVKVKTRFVVGDIERRIGFKNFIILEKVEEEWLIVDTDFHQQIQKKYVIIIDKGFKLLESVAIILVFILFLLLPIVTFGLGWLTGDPAKTSLLSGAPFVLFSVFITYEALTDPSAQFYALGLGAIYSWGVSFFYIGLGYIAGYIGRRNFVYDKEEEFKYKLIKKESRLSPWVRLFVAFLLIVAVYFTLRFHIVIAAPYFIFAIIYLKLGKKMEISGAKKRRRREIPTYPPLSYPKKALKYKYVYSFNTEEERQKAEDILKDSNITVKSGPMRGPIIYLGDTDFITELDEDGLKKILPNFDFELDEVRNPLKDTTVHILLAVLGLIFMIWFFHSIYLS